VITALVFLGIGMSCYVAAFLLSRTRVRQQRQDPALHIKPPRRYVDADGRSDFRQATADAVRRYREGRR
jgi:hypothetical protein